MTKPWLESWDYKTVANAFPLADDEPRARLAAASPMLARALLAVELGGYGHSNCDFVGVSCPGCGAEALETSVPPPHENGCPVDAALTAAGLPDQASRDEARKEIAAKDDDLALRERARTALRDLVQPPPRPELYEQMIAAGTWPLSISKEQAAEYWSRR